jgi:hypothetical protein
MWQRIQTLYLLIATGLLAAMCFCDAAVIYEGGQAADSISYWDKTVYWVLLLATLLGHLIAVNTYKLLVLQLRVTTVTLLATLGFGIVLAIDYLRAPEGLVFGITAVFPLVCAVLDGLALRGIFRDQIILESAYRLRDHHRRSGREKR